MQQSHTQHFYRCKNCSTTEGLRTDASQGVIVCTSCGCVQESGFIDQAAEWRNFSSDGNQDQSGQVRASGKVNEFLSDGGLGTQASKKDAYKMQNIFNRTMKQEDQQYHRGVEKLRNWGASLEYNDAILKKAIQFYQIARSNKHLSGKNQDAILATILFLSARQEGQALDPQVIAEISQQKPQTILGIWNRIKKYEPQYAVHLQMNPKGQIQSIMKSLNLPYNVEFNAWAIAEQITNLGLLEGKMQRTIASVAIYITVNLTEGEKKISYREIAEAAGLAETTLKQSYNQLQLATNIKNIVHQWNGRLPFDAIPFKV